MAAVTGQPADRCDFRHGQGRHCKKTLPARLVKTGTKGGEKASEVEEGAEKKPPSGCRDPAVDELASWSQENHSGRVHETRLCHRRP